MEHSHNSQGNSLLFPLTFDLSFIQQVKKVRPRTAMNMVERRTWSKYSLLLSHTPSYSFMNTPSSLAYIPTSHTETLRLLFCLQLASFPQKKKKSANRCFWHEKFSRPPLPQSQLLPTLWSPWFFRVQAAPINYSLHNFQGVFELFSQAFSSNLEKTSATTVD